MYIRHFADPIYKAVFLCLTVYWSSSSASEFYTIIFFCFWVCLSHVYKDICLFVFTTLKPFPPKAQKESPFLPPPSCKHLIPVIKCLSILPQIPSCSLRSMASRCMRPSGSAACFPRTRPAPARLLRCPEPTEVPKAPQPVSGWRRMQLADPVCARSSVKWSFWTNSALWHLGSILVSLIFHNPLDCPRTPTFPRVI